MKVLVLGSNGMAGHIITQYLTKCGHEVITVARTNASYDLDIENPLLVKSFFNYLPEVDYVINCIGLLVKDSIDRPDRAALINAWFPHFLENKFRNTNTRVIHLSTDCVFNGSKGNYVETDLHTETNAYGKSKSLGEINNDKDITFRMSIIGPELKQNGTGLMHWLTTNPDKEVFGWENAHWNGVTTLQLAKSINKYMMDPCFAGVYHLVSPKSIDKFELLTLMNDVFNLDKTVIRTLGSKSVNKVLVDTRKLVKYVIPAYNVQLAELKNFAIK
jgi:dTDP-4-dehydrorhamnose reductase